MIHCNRLRRRRGSEQNRVRTRQGTGRGVQEAHALQARVPLRSRIPQSVSEPSYLYAPILRAIGKIERLRCLITDTAKYLEHTHMMTYQIHARQMAEATASVRHRIRSSVVGSGSH